MSKGRSTILSIGISGGAGVVIYLLIQLLLALLVVKNILPENRLMVLQVAAGGVSALFCGFLAMKTTAWVPAAGLTGVFIAVLTAVLGFLVYNRILLDSDTLLRIGAMLLGGIFPSVLLGKKGRKRRGKTMNGRVRRT